MGSQTKTKTQNMGKREGSSISEKCVTGMKTKEQETMHGASTHHHMIPRPWAATATGTRTEKAESVHRLSYTPEYQ